MSDTERNPTGPEVLPRILWADPFRRLANELRAEAEALRVVGGEKERADFVDALAVRVEERIGAAAHGEWVRSEDAAQLRGIEPDSVRAWCRRSLAPRGLARKLGGHWHIHVHALGAESGRAA